jgi:uncharacterized protein (TIGR02466 family)
LDNISLFGAPVATGIIDDIITDEEKQFLHSVETMRMASDNGYHSLNTKILNLPELAGLQQKLCDQFLYYADSIGISKKVEWKLVTSWLNIHGKGDWAHQHLHKNCLFSGILYTQVDDNSGDLVFHNQPHSLNLIPSTISLEMETFNACNSNSWNVTPLNNLLVFFPSTLLHSVNLNQSDSYRYSLAFNFFPMGKLGYGIDELSL